MLVTRSPQAVILGYWSAPSPSLFGCTRGNQFYYCYNNTSDKEHDREEMRAKERRGKFWTARTAMSGPEGGKNHSGQGRVPDNNSILTTTKLQKTQRCKNMTGGRRTRNSVEQGKEGMKEQATEAAPPQRAKIHSEHVGRHIESERDDDDCKRPTTS